MIRHRTRLRRFYLKGISLLEVTAVLMMMAILLSSLIPGVIDRIDRAKFEKTINEMTSIAQACVDYYNSQYPKAWPSAINPWVPTSVLVPRYMYNLVSVSPWKSNYEVSFQNDLVVVSTNIPSGIAQSNPEGGLWQVTPGKPDDQISIAQSVPDQGTAGLEYAEKYFNS